MGMWTEKAKEVQPIMELGKLANRVGITAEQKPSILPERPGFTWEPMLNPDSKTIGWQEVEDPNAFGTADNPIVWVPGMNVQENYFYTSKNVRYVCVKSGAPTKLSVEYFEKF